MLLPIGMMAAMPAPFFTGSLNSAILLGLALAATSVSISVQTLVELKRLRTPEGMTLLGAAVVDDVLVILALSIYTSIMGVSGGESGLLVISIRMFLTLTGCCVFGYMLLPRLVDWAANRLPISQAMMTAVLVAALFFAWVSEFAGGVAAITGAYIAGVGLGRTHWREEIARELQTMNYAFFVPIFLVGVGLQANVRNLSLSIIPLGIVLVVVAVVSKILGRAHGRAFYSSVVPGWGRDDFARRGRLNCRWRWTKFRLI
jgi:Kef-type K+ transport system membrane component KefB